MSQQLGAAPPTYGLNPSLRQRIPQLGSSFPTQTPTSPPTGLPPTSLPPYGRPATQTAQATPATTQLSQQQALQYKQRLITQQMMKSPYAPQTATSPNPLTAPQFNPMNQLQKEQFFQRQQLSRQHQMRQQQLAQARVQAAAARAQAAATGAATKAPTTNPFAAAARQPQYVPNRYGSANRNPLQQNQNRLNQFSKQSTTTQPTHPATAAAANAYLPNAAQTLPGYRKPYIPNLNATQLPQPQQAPQVPQTTTAILNGQQTQTATQTQAVTQQQQQTQQQNVNAGVSTPGTPGTEQSGVDTMSQSSKYNESYNNNNNNTQQGGFTKQPQYPVLPGRKYVNITQTQYNDPLRQIKVTMCDFAIFSHYKQIIITKDKLQRNDHLVGYRTRPNYFSWGRRGPLLFEEIKKGGADIICLQGCDQFDYFQEKLSPRGFVGVYERTTKPLQMQNVYFGDGLAIFWRTNKFELSGRQKFLLGDNRFISNIALLARLKRRSPFIDPTNMDFLRNPQNIVYESNIKCKNIGGDKNLWCVLSTKYLYLFNDKQHYESPLKYFDLDTFYQIKNSNSNLNDTSFILYPRQKNINNISSIEFETGDVNKNLMWIKNIKTAQIGIEIDVWNTHLIEGHSMKCEYRRVKQAQVLFECMSRASAQNNLIDKNIGSKYNPYSSNNNYKFYQDVLDKKAATQTNQNSQNNGAGGKLKADLSILSTGIGNNASSRNTTKSVTISGGGNTDLAERFKKMMEKRIKTSETSKLPVRIDPNVKDGDNKDENDDDEKKGNDDNRPGIGLSLDPINSSNNIKSNGTTKQTQQENDDPPFQVPTQLHRPVILCCDTESNAHGDYDYQIPPLSYTYLTMKSRTTQNNAFFNYSMKQLTADPSTQTDRHNWFLQSAYALGFGNEPELTSFNRYWPNEATKKGLTEFGSNNIDSATKRIDFNQSIEIVKCSDFILFSPQHFRVLKLLEPLEKDWIMRKWNKTLPCVDYPSDHTMIGVEFELAIPTMPGTHMMNLAGAATSSVPSTTSGNNQQQPSTPGLIPQTPTTPNMSVGLKTPTTTGLPTPTPSTTTNPGTQSLTNIGTSMATTAIPSIHYTPTGSNNSYNSPFANQYTQRAFAAQHTQFQPK